MKGGESAVEGWSVDGNLLKGGIHGLGDSCYIDLTGTLEKASPGLVHQKLELRDLISYQM